MTIKSDEVCKRLNDTINWELMGLDDAEAIEVVKMLDKKVQWAKQLFKVGEENESIE